MSRRYSVLFVALALVVAMAAGAWAWSIPTFSGADATNVANGTKIDAVGVSLDYDGQEYGTWTAEPRWASRDITAAATELVVLCNSTDVPISEDGFVFAPGWGVGIPEFLTGATSVDSVDGLLVYAGRGVRNIPMAFQVGSGDAAGDLVAGARFTVDAMTFGSGLPTFDVFSDDANPVADALGLAGTVCAGGECNSFVHTEMRVASRDQNGNAWANGFVSSDMGIFVYMPCGDFVKEWQVYNRRAYDLSWNPANAPRTAEAVFPQDMVRYSASVSGTHSLALGSYVVEVSADNAGRIHPDVLVERILNKTGASVQADLRQPADGTTYFNWLPIGEGWRGQTAFRGLSADVTVRGNDTAYLQFQEWDTNRTTASGYTWYSWFKTTDRVTDQGSYKDVDGVAINGALSVDLAPGFARYYIASADTSKTLEMCFNGSGEAVCQATTIDPQIWAHPNVCINSGDFDFSDCFGVMVMSADEAVRTDLATWTGITAPVYTTESTACGTCAGQITMRTDVNTFLEPFTTLAAADGATVCLGASMDVVINNAVCSYNLEDLHLVRVTFKVAPQRICDTTVRANVAAAMAKLGDPVNKPLDVAPADAFLNPVSVDSTLGDGVDIVVVLPDGTSANLVDLAKANDYVDATVAHQGIKNYFELWAWQNESVWEAWTGNAANNDNEALLSFHVAVVNGNAPDGESAIQAKKGYFLIYAGDVNESLTNQVAGYLTYFALMTGYNGSEPTPTPTPAPSMTVTSTPAGTTAAATCSTFTKESFSSEAWTAILAALGVTDESAYTFAFSGVECLTSDVAGLTAGQSVAYTVTYDDGIASAADTASGRMVFVYNVTDSKYDVLPEVATEVSIATEQTKNAAVAEGSEYDANVATDALQVGFSLVSAVATPVTATPTTAPSSGGGSGCSFGFAPLALVLLAPLALLKK